MNDFPKKDASAFGLSDLLPPALVKDMRQLVRSPLALSLLAFCFLILLLPSKDEGDGFGFIFFISFVILCAFVPMRSSSVVNRDIRERGSNFLQLCPLSAWRIVAGQFLSAAVQIILLGLCLAPFLWDLVMPEPAALLPPQEGHSVINGIIAEDFRWFLLVGMMMFALLQTAFLMALACLPAILRFLVVIKTGAGMWIGVFALVWLGREPLSQEGFPLEALLSLGALWLIFLLCFLLLARRYYCSSVEMDSGLLRLLVLLATGCVICFEYVQDLHADTCSSIYDIEVNSWGIYLLCIIILDELLPRDTGSVVPQRFKGFIGFWRRPSSSSHFAFMLVMVLIFAATRYAFFLSNDCTAAELSMSTCAEQAPLLALYVPLSIFTFLYVPLAMTNIISKSNNRVRIVIYFICMFLVSLFTAFAQAMMRDFAPEILPYISWPTTATNSFLSPSTPFVWYIVSSALFCLISFGLMRLVQACRQQSS